MKWIAFYCAFCVSASLVAQPTNNMSEEGIECAPIVKSDESCDLLEKGYTVSMSCSYETGKMDALPETNGIAKGVLCKLLGVVFVGTFVISMTCFFSFWWNKPA